MSSIQKQAQAGSSTQIYTEQREGNGNALRMSALLSIDDFNFGAVAFASPSSPLNTRLTHHASKLSRAPKCLGHRPTAIQQFAHDVMSVAEVQACATLKLHNMNMMMYFKFRIPVWTKTLKRTVHTSLAAKCTL